jgi:hypothetical protein
VVQLKSMKGAIPKMGNLQDVLIPKPILAQLGLESTAEGADALVWPEVANEGDAELVW